MPAHQVRKSRCGCLLDGLRSNRIFSGSAEGVRIPGCQESVKQLIALFSLVKGSGPVFSVLSGSG